MLLLRLCTSSSLHGPSCVNVNPSCKSCTVATQSVNSCMFVCVGTTRSWSEVHWAACWTIIVILSTSEASNTLIVVLLLCYFFWFDMLFYVLLSVLLITFSLSLWLWLSILSEWDYCGGCRGLDECTLVENYNEDIVDTTCGGEEEEE